MSLASFLFQKALLPFRESWIARSRELSVCVECQEKTLLTLIRNASRTQFGLDHHFSSVRSVSEYQKSVPIRSYEDFFNDSFRPAGEAAAKRLKIFYDPNQASPYLENVTWPGLVPFFALSSGTTSGKTKFIPLTRELIRSNRRAGIDTAVFHFLRNPKTGALSGKTFLLGGNLSLRSDWNGKVESGDLSGVLARELPFFCRSLYFPGKQIGSIADWEEKMDRAAEAGLKDNLTVLGGVPSWVLLFLETLNQKRNFKGNIKSIWPNFELFIHGGISFEPYREQFRAWLGPETYFEEVYPSSEAFIAIEDPREKALRLMVDYGTFYEFVPVEELSGKNPTRLTLTDIETDQNYAIVLTTNGGLWSYLLGDTVRFLSKEPLLLKVTGMTKYFLSAFGEHVIQEEIETALHRTCSEQKTTFIDYHAAPIFPSGESPVGRHQYLIEFVKSPTDLKQFVSAFDRCLQTLNEDYAAHRSGDYGMREPEIMGLPQGFFRLWMKKKGKLGAQHKVPRISGDRDLIDDMLGFLRSTENFLERTI